MSPPVSDEGAFLLRRSPVPATSWFPEVRSILLGAVCACACVVAVTQLGQVVCFAPGGAGFHTLLGQNPFGLTKELQPETVTLVAACKMVNERIPAFQTAIQSWAAASTDSNAGGKRAFDRVIIVDWSSDASLWQEVLNFWNVATPLGFYRVGDADGNNMDWASPKTYNFGFEKVRTEVILKVDCDTFVARGLLVLNPIESKDGSKKNFRYGDYRAARDDNEIHSNGCVMATKQTMKSVNYYDELLQQYGWEDYNFSDRLFASGATPMNITRVNGGGKTMLTHVWHPHSDATQDERVVLSCQNRCAINHVERQNAWVGLRRAAFWKHDAEFPGAFAPANKHISFENCRGGALASVKEVLGKTTAGLIETWKPKRGVRQHQVPRRVRLE